MPLAAVVDSVSSVVPRTFQPELAPDEVDRRLQKVSYLLVRVDLGKVLDYQRIAQDMAFRVVAFARVVAGYEQPMTVDFKERYADMPRQGSVYRPQRAEIRLDRRKQRRFDGSAGTT